MGRLSVRRARQTTTPDNHARQPRQTTTPDNHARQPRQTTTPDNLETDAAYSLILGRLDTLHCA
jgi:hypothetical protein